jgi:hypothetical protein
MAYNGTLRSVERFLGVEDEELADDLQRATRQPGVLVRFKLTPFHERLVPTTTVRLQDKCANGNFGAHINCGIHSQCFFVVVVEVDGNDVFVQFRNPVPVFPLIASRMNSEEEAESLLHGGKGEVERRRKMLRSSLLALGPVQEVFNGVPQLAAQFDLDYIFFLI